MRYINFLSKVLCLIVVVAALAFYQNQASANARTTEENQAAVESANAYNESLMAEVEGAAASPYTDGVYEGSGAGFGGDIKVSITITDGKLADIQVLDHSGEDNAYYSQAEAIVDKMLKAGKAEVDTVSGATFSSKGLIAAVSNAMGKAVK